MGPTLKSKKIIQIKKDLATKPNLWSFETIHNRYRYPKKEIIAAVEDIFKNDFQKLINNKILMDNTLPMGIFQTSTDL